MKNKSVRRAARCGMALVAVATLAGCDRIGNPLEALGSSIPPPDEFQVIASKPLEIPADKSLPEPRPGAASPLAPDPHRDARVALLGPGAAPEPTATGAGPSTGEQVLLSSANAAASSEDIRVQLEKDKRQSDANKPYEPPSLIELLGGKEKKKNDPDLLDAQVESERLLQAGTPTTVDPTPEVDDKTPKEPSEIGEYPPGRPQSPFSKDKTRVGG